MPGDLSRWAVRGAGRGAAREAVAPSPQETSNPLGRWSANKLDRWKTGAQTIAEDGDSPFRPINEQHPEISTMDRLKIMNVTGGRNPVAIHNLQKMGYEVQQRGHYDFSVRKPGKKWHRLDPEKGFFSLETLKDIADGLGGMFTLGTSLAAAAPVATATGLTAAPTGGASLAGGMAATSAAAGAGGAVGEGILTELGKRSIRCTKGQTISLLR